MTIIDTPNGIANWRFASAVSLLSLEISTGRNYYGKVSVYKAIRRDYIDGLPERATVDNKILALMTLLENATDEFRAGPVATRALEVVRDNLVKRRKILTMPDGTFWP